MGGSPAQIQSYQHDLDFFSLIALFSNIYMVDGT